MLAILPDWQQQKNTSVVHEKVRLMSNQDAPLADLFSGAGPNLYTISPDRPFLRDLAGTLLDRHSADPARLSDLTIFLPTRRAARALTDTFLTLAGPNPSALLLPRIKTLGDIDDEGVPDFGSVDRDLTPAISALERRLVLANLVHKRNSVCGEEGGAPNWATNLKAADELASMLDAFYTEQVSFDNLQSLVPENYATHWQVTLEFLEIITKAWPNYLASRDRLDPSEHRHQLIEALCAKWDESLAGTAPVDPVIIAGSTGSMPAVARLMQLVAGLPVGCVILPGLDQVLDDTGWTEIEDPHPQAGIKYFLEKYFVDLPRTDVQAWPTVAHAIRSTDRQQLISLTLRPAEATADWLARLHDLQSTADLQRATKGLSLVEAADEAAEAQAIAIALRAVLAEKDKTAILVTPDRILARRVSMLLERWNIKLDDSAGVPFANTLRGNFLRLVAAWLIDPSEPVSLLALLKHPLCAVGFDRKSHAARVLEMDLMLRGLQPGEGFTGLRARLEGGAEWDALSRDENATSKQDAQQSERFRDLIDRLENIAASFYAAGRRAGELIRAHIHAAEQIAATDTEQGWLRLWSYEDGEAGASALAELLDQAVLLPATDRASYPELFLTLIAGTPVRFHGRLHPRLMILGPLEARLQQADLVILASLNEGTWPDEARTDSFLSRPMRKELGLSSPERRVGLAAHDFAQGVCAREVLLTRSKRVERAPSKPSRWLLRLKNILSATKQLENIDQTNQYHYWAGCLDTPETMKNASPPAPCPPLEARPRAFSVTAVEKLLRDPYSIYASRILRLYKLDDFNMDPGFAMRGRFYHHLFARFALEHPRHMPTDPVGTLLRYADELFNKACVGPSVRAFWQSRMQDSFAWFTEFHEAALKKGTPVIVEQKGSWKFFAGGEIYTLHARPDRIDYYKEGLFIYDYKTGAVPTDKQGKTFSPQLQLTALIAQHNGFTDTPTILISGYAFLKALNRTKPDTLIVGPEAAAGTEQAKENLYRLLRHYQNPSEPYLSQPRPFYRNVYGEYDHLARTGEWTVLEGDDG